MAYTRHKPTTIGGRIAVRRSWLGLTQKALADRMGVKHHTIVNWERNLSPISDDQMAALATHLTVSEDYLRHREGVEQAIPLDEDRLPAFSAALDVVSGTEWTLVEAEALKARIDRKVRDRWARQGNQD